VVGEALEGGVYLVCNDYLRTSSNGIRYRASPRDADKVLNVKPVMFGTAIEGVPYDADWLKVGKHFLPMAVHGKPVLICLDTSQEIADVQPREDSHLPVWMQRREYEAPRQEGDVPEVVYRDVPSKVIAPHAPGSGELHIVVSERIRVRQRPSTDAFVENFKTQWSVVELFDWDEKQQWRMCFEATHSCGRLGWILLKHPDLGTLVQSVESVCSVAAAGKLAELQKHIDGLRLHDWPSNSARHPLRSAAEIGCLGCCTLLLQAGIDFEALIQDGSLQFPWKMRPSARRVLLVALSGSKSFELEEFEAALADLPSVPRAAAERLFEDVALGRPAIFVVPPDLQDPSRVETGRPAERRSAEPRQEEEARGTLHRVVNSVCIRSHPHERAEGIGMRHAGSVVELLDLDASGQWRRLRTGTEPSMQEPSGSGWMLLRHPTLGALVQPVDPTIASFLEQERGKLPPASGGERFAIHSEEEVLSEADSDDDKGKSDSWDKLFARR